MWCRVDSSFSAECFGFCTLAFLIPDLLVLATYIAEHHLFCRASNHFDVSDTEGDQRCPSAPLLTPRDVQEMDLHPVLGDVPTNSKLALHHAENQQQG